MSDQPLPLLDIKGLKLEAKVNGVWSDIVHGVDLSLNRGEVLGLIGESGAGKSTIGLAAMGFARNGCRISGGSVLFDGQDLVSISDRKRRRLRGSRIAYVAQSAAAAFNPAYSLMRQYCESPVRFGLRGRDEAEADAKALYEKMQLPTPHEIGFRYPHQVSGGQLQRAMTAMAMSCRPDLIIFDEPTTALDVTTQIQVLGTIRNIVREFNTAALYITHDLAVVAQMADRIKVLRHGKEVEEAETHTMLANPQAEYTKTLWAVREFRKAAQPAPARDAVPLASLRNVTASYGPIDVLSDISFDVHRRRTLAVVGESGSGKSTAARCLTGLLPPKQGEVLFEGQPLASDFRKRSLSDLRRIQMIYQMAETALNPRKRIGDIIGRPVSQYLGLNAKARKERVRELLRLIEMEPDEFINRMPPSLSGGQKQRIGIARALAAEPDLIICDEVTSALDQVVAEGMLKLLDRLQAELGVSYMFITHDIQTVRAIADDVIVMQHGRIVEANDVDSILTNPQQDYTRKLLKSVPEMDAGWLEKQLAD
ncbi:ABC transporter ATP-binding protein [Pseudohalocynthiibacter aestuariivivens]|nr:ABC transporter ATP-binding protein [Pseudohalocynthiibacter aestuariivivens]QIE46286.1 ABC transporter ATP-binding protein [Pseudohalocynthiibacter aestuariivivens]